MSSVSKQLEVKTSPPTRKNATPRLPHERDESEDSQAMDGRREDMQRAYKDLQEGQVDTDLRGVHGVDEVVNDLPEPTPEKIINKRS
jgi:hypothetical protein